MIDKLERMLSSLSGISDDERAELGACVLECRQMENELTEMKKVYQLITGCVVDVISIYDLDMRLKYVTPSVYALRGITVEEALVQPLENVLTPDSLALVNDIFIEEMQLETDEKSDPKRNRIVELEQCRKDGSTIWTELTLSYIRDGKNDIRGFIAVTRDISQRKRDLEERKKLEDRLVQAAKMEAIGTLAGGIAHDFNNLLAGIQGYASLLSESLSQSSQLTPVYADWIDKIERQVQSGAALTKQLLGFARKGKYSLELIDMNDILRETSMMFGRTRKEIVVYQRFCPDLWNVMADGGQMEQVLLNLLVNAQQAMLSGGTIYLETDNVVLSQEHSLPESVPPGRYVKITVTDTGSGMDEQTRLRIFEPFFTTKEMGRGTGLGLATVYGIVKGHRGMINVYSEVNYGSTFRIYLPAIDGDRGGEVVEKKDQQNYVGNGELILLIDDEEAVREVGSEMLRRKGYEVVIAASGKEAVEVYEGEKSRFALIILDMIMPEILGGEVFDALRQIDPNAKVILSSGYSLNGEAEKIMARGCNGFIQKPFTLSEISRKVREVLDGK